MRGWVLDVLAIIKDVNPRVLLFVWGVTTVVVGMAGPFGTFETLGFGLRVLYWGGVIGVAICAAVSLRIFWRSIVKGDPAILEDGLVISSLAIVFGPFVVGLNAYLWPDDDSAIAWQFVSAVTFAVGVGTVGLRRMMGGPAAAIHPKRDRLLERINAPEGVRLARVSSDNHHIRITTSDGIEYRILMRLRDAVREIDVEEGFCIHRSHWLALDHMDRVVEEDGRDLVEMPCGLRLPIGPKYRTNLVEAGFLNA